MENRKTLFNNKTGEVNSESDFKGNLVKKNNFRPTGAAIDQAIKSILTLVSIFKVEGEKDRF